MDVREEKGELGDTPNPAGSTPSIQKDFPSLQAKNRAKLLMIADEAFEKFDTCIRPSLE